MTDLAALQELKAIRSLAEKQLKATQENSILLSQLIQALAEEEGIDDLQDDNEISYLNSRVSVEQVYNDLFKERTNRKDED